MVRGAKIATRLYLVCTGNSLTKSREFLEDVVGSEHSAPAEGDGWAELQDDGSLEGKICLLNGDDISFIARRSKTSSIACQLSRMALFGT
jgi:hypothetical protein